MGYIPVDSLKKMKHFEPDKWVKCVAILDGFDLDETMLAWVAHVYDMQEILPNLFVGLTIANAGGFSNDVTSLWPEVETMVMFSRCYTGTKPSPPTNL